MVVTMVDQKSPTLCIKPRWLRCLGTYQGASAVDARVASVDTVEPLGLAELPEALFGHGGGRERDGQSRRKDRYVGRGGWSASLELGCETTDGTEDALSTRTASPLNVKPRCTCSFDRNALDSVSVGIGVVGLVLGWKSMVRRRWGCYTGEAEYDD